MDFITYIIIVLAVSGALAYWKHYSKRRQAERAQDVTVTPGHFSIVQDMGLLVIVFWIGLVFSVVLFVGLLHEGERLLMGLIPIGFFLLSAYALASVYVWRIDVDGDRISYRNALGKRREYSIQEITRVVAVPKNGMYLYRYRFYSGEKRLFTVDENTDNVFLLQRLTERGVYAENKGRK